ncbi:hypothetical protein DFH09DRAFT_329376 [Mycena vulgaris]|nr:hypothetical protein DFH09DRAFT_329376 [Mycena vulgaris]
MRPTHCSRVSPRAHLIAAVLDGSQALYRDLSGTLRCSLHPQRCAHLAWGPSCTSAVHVATQVLARRSSGYTFRMALATVEHSSASRRRGGREQLGLQGTSLRLRARRGCEYEWQGRGARTGKERKARGERMTPIHPCLVAGKRENCGSRIRPAGR